MTIRSVIRMWPYELLQLPEYSITTPTGVCPYKMWRCAKRDPNAIGPHIPDGRKTGWRVGQFLPINGMLWTCFHEVALYQGPWPERLPPLRFKVSCEAHELQNRF